MAFSPHWEMAVRLAQYRTEEAQLFGGMRQVHSLEVLVFFEHRLAAKQASFLTERARPLEGMQWLAPMLPTSERRKVGNSKQARLFETV